MHANKVHFHEDEADTVGAVLRQKKRRFKSAADWHAFNLILTIALVLLVVECIISRNMPKIVLLALTYAFYLLECLWLSDVSRNMVNMKDQVTGVDLIKKLKSSVPSLHFRIQCYHFESHELNVKQGPDTTGQSVRKRVNTFSDTIQFKYCNWVDESDTVVGLENFGVVKLNLHKSLHYLDRDTEDTVRAEFDALQQRNRDKDDQMDSEMWTAMSGFLEYSRIVYATDSPPWWMSLNVYIIFSLLLMSWPHRLFFETRTGELEYTVRKCITIYDDLDESIKNRPTVPPLILGAVKGTRSAITGLSFVVLVIALLSLLILLFPRAPDVCVKIGYWGNSDSTRSRTARFTTGAFDYHVQTHLEMRNNNLFALDIEEVEVSVGTAMAASKKVAMVAQGGAKMSLSLPARDTIKQSELVKVGLKGTQATSALIYASKDVCQKADEVFEITFLLNTVLKGKHSKFGRQFAVKLPGVSIKIMCPGVKGVEDAVDPDDPNGKFQYTRDRKPDGTTPLVCSKSSGSPAEMTVTIAHSNKYDSNYLYNNDHNDDKNFLDILFN
eukprot:GHVR01032438.1.p1 GENE.GHVR01032438.1~~GHVR01032438.1.p1  ORF type:complete len:554 (+),score=91.71 GHVR01032438.1:84-1745(+)